MLKIEDPFTLFKFYIDFFKRGEYLSNLKDNNDIKLFIYNRLRENISILTKADLLDFD
jgi:hypothetical protein